MSYDLGRLDPSTFEHMVVSLALRELGAGVTMFGPGPDGGRDGYFEGEANYPSPAERWKGRWYIQSKYHAFGLTDDAQGWLRSQITAELKAFEESKRQWPDVWIVITNVDPSATPGTGTFDVTRQKVAAARPELADRFHIWGGKKITDFLSKHQDIAERYGEFLTPGNVLKAMYDALQDDRASAERIVRHLIAGQIVNQAYAKLEQAGKSGDMPGLHRLFTDVPFYAAAYDLSDAAAATLAWTSNRNQRPSTDSVSGDAWRMWRRHPSRARTWFVRGGPGQGKSTLGQFFAQVQRAWFLLTEDFGPLNHAQRTVATELQTAAESLKIWPASGRIPVLIELRDYAQWLGALGESDPRGILTYLSQQWRKALQQDVPVGMILRLLAQRRWFLVFDGLDEVPQDVKDTVAAEVRRFLDEDVYERDADVLVLCTSRPQGYSGQFDALDAVTIDLTPLTIEQALACAEPLLRFQQSEDDAERDIRILKESSESDSVKQLMTTPLQSHIMAVVVRGGHRPPERRWKLFDNFYEVILKREANRPGIDPRLAEIFKRHDDLLKTVHNRLGFVLHARAELSAGAQANLRRSKFEEIVRAAAQEMLDEDVEPKVRALMEATTDRLVLVNTPDDGDHVRFDVRQFQEFFAAEFLREDDPSRPVSMQEAFELLGADPHWREVTHFLLSALVEEKQWKDIDALSSVLQRFDDGDETSRLVHRRLARGALAVARLLAEGVLEQDKRVRVQLRAALMPTFGTTDGAAFFSLSEVMQPQSHAWLTGVALNALADHSLAESVGAASLLVQLLGPDDPRTAELQKLVRSAPASIAVALLASFGPAQEVPPWLVALVLDLLRRPESLTLSQSEVRELFHWLSRHSWQRRAAAAQMEYDERCHALLDWLATHPLGEAGEEKGVPAQYWPHDWATETVPPLLGRARDQRVPMPSLLGVADAIARFVEERSVATLRHAALTVAMGDPAALPRHVMAPMPMTGEEAVGGYLSILEEATDADLITLREEHCLRGRPVVRTATFSHTAFVEDRTAWENLVAHRVSVAVQMFELNDRVLDVVPLGRRLLTIPFAALHRPNLWGLFFRIPEVEADLRRAIRETARSCPPIVAYAASIHPFTMTLPEDAPLLPHIVAAIAKQYEVVRRSRLWEGSVTEYASDLAALRAIRGDKERPVAERLAALVFCWMFPNGNGLGEVSWSLLRQFDPDAHPWFLSAAAMVLLRSGSPHYPLAVKIAEHLTTVIRDNYRHRTALDRVYVAWRENSSAPVTSANVLHEWVHRAPPPAVDNARRPDRPGRKSH